MNKLEEVLENCPNNLIIFDSFVKTNSTVPQYKNVAIGISGGADSDIVIDIMRKLFHNINYHFVWYDTGIEYQATKEHLKFLENKYDVEIKEVKAIKPIPISVKEYGQPFISKYVSEMIQRLQRHNFDFKDAYNKTFEELFNIYSKCKVALKWWCNENGENSSFNIKRNKKLKEFLATNPPKFKISNACCQWAKKKVADKFIKENDIDLNIIGVRKSEGGIRSTAYSTCFDREKDKNVANFRPIFWYKDSDKLEYNAHYKILNSLCYSGYGLSRTGCAGCPFGKDFEEELEIIEANEPKLFHAVNKIFGDSYEYTRKYKIFKDIDQKQIKFEL